MPETSKLHRPYTTVVLAMSADGKIADHERSPARFSSAADRVHLEKQVALSDGILFGAETLRTYGTTLSVTTPELQERRKEQGLPAQPVQIVCSRTAEFDSQLRFFRQQVPRWLLTTATGAAHWQGKEGSFERILVVEQSQDGIDWHAALPQLAQLGLARLGCLGGGELVASLLAADVIDEFWLTVCPLLLGGRAAPTPVGGEGFLAEGSRRLELLSVEAIAEEVFLHYRRQHS